MSVIFNEEGLRDINPPCVAQTFVNHNATLYKLFKVGSKLYVGQRPSLKNLYAGGTLHILLEMFNTTALKLHTSVKSDNSEMHVKVVPLFDLKILVKKFNKFNIL